VELKSYTKSDRNHQKVELDLSHSDVSRLHIALLQLVDLFMLMKRILKNLGKSNIQILGCSNPYDFWTVCYSTY